PEHPVNRGKLCARGQAVVQEQYHPDRVRSPLLNGAAAMHPIDWNRALDELVTSLRTLRTNGRAADVVLITPPLRGHQALLVDTFARAYGLQWLPFEPLPELPLVEAARRVFGSS